MWRGMPASTCQRRGPSGGGSNGACCCGVCTCGRGRWRDNEQPGRLAARSGQVHAVGHPVTPDVFPASPCRRPMPVAAWQAPRAVRPRSPVLTPQDRAPPPFGDGRPALSGGQREVLLIPGNARPHRVRPADPLKPGRDLGVIQVRVIATLAADELKRVGIAAFHPALHDAGGWRRRLAVRPWPG